MSLIDVKLQRRRHTKTIRPNVEQLEARECLAVAAPTGLQLAALSPTQIKVSWNDVAGESGYRVYRWDGAKAVVTATVAANIKTFTITNMPPNQVQWFQVESFDFSTTARSIWASVKTPAETIAAVTNLRVTSTTQTQVNLAWTNATGALGYRVYGWDGVRSVLLGSTTPTVPAFTVSNLKPGSVYYFMVQAFNNTNMANSGWVTATTMAQGLIAPGNLTTQVVNANTLGLSWSDVTGETGYRIFRWNGVTGVQPVVIATLAANTTGFQATGLLPGTTYWFYVQAYNATAFANTTWVSAATAAALPLQAPTQLSIVTTGPNSIILSWTEPARAVGYGIYQWTAFGWALLTNVPRGTHSLPMSGLAAGRTHWFMVSAYTDGFAEVAYSTAVFATL
jgi:hypothetical protein